MAVQTILKMGDPRLLLIATEVVDFDDGLQLLLKDMLDTMLAYDGIGIAAPQIGVAKRVIIYGIEKSVRYPEFEPVPLTILVNPKITPLSEAKQGCWEGCLSVPGMRGYVERCRHIRLTAQNEGGETFSKDIENHEAIVVQHEVDHLEGILYPQQLKDIRQFGYSEALTDSLNRELS